MIKIFEMFAGYGTATFALKQLGIEHEVVGFSEIDKYAIQCFQQNHGSKNYGDCTKINPNDLPDFDLLTGGFPCQAFSTAGKQLGELDPRGTLFYEIIRIAEVKKPRYMLLENVKGLTGKKFKDTFNKILSELDRIGYDVHWKVLNTKDYGVPQSRSRVWFVCFDRASLLADERKFKWPEPIPLKLFIKDILEENVDEKYYLSETLQERFKHYIEEKNKKLSKDDSAILDLYNKKVKDDGTSITLTEPHHNNLRLIEANICAMRSFPRTGSKTTDEERQQQLETRKDGCSNSLTSVEKDNFIIENKIKREQIDLGNGYNSVKNRYYYTDGVMACIPNANPSNKCNIIENRLRRLTPKECFRLQGFLKDEVNLDGISDTQCYKLAGNGQSVNVVKKIFERLLL